MKVLAAMSGGVDSAVAAARAVDAGHDVVGVHLALSRMPGTLRTGSRGCCTIEDSMDAQRAANMIGIPYYVWDFSERFKLDVVDDFVAEYSAGRTPNPCMRCNERIKFAALLEKAMALGFDAVATGHYASIVTDADGKPRFVLEVRPKDNTVVVGPKEALDIAEIAGSTFSWAGLAPLDPTIPFDCEVQIRAHADPVPAVARVSVVEGRTELVITPNDPLNGVAPGQTAVVYVGTRVLGQCTIDRTVSAVPLPVPVS
jgi:tRNA U34 2-thiouridine synthase MnmA/TrmU